MQISLTVIGLGYVGLPVAQEACRSGLRVTGLDVAENVVDDLNSGISHIDDISDSDLAMMLNEGFSATMDASVLTDADVVVICVPTPLSQEGTPDLGAVLSASRTVGRNLRRGALVILESTT